MSLQAIKQRFGIIGNSEALDNALQRAIDVAPTDLTVLITGESGVGKEVFSKIIHSLSSRKHNNFIAVNCGAIPEGTINSELFGHVKGAFTGAATDRKGYFETVSGGTIFLDEIGEMPLETQSFLLRILESGEFIPVGSSKVLKTDVRVVAATNVSLLDAIEKGRFRRDLYYRLSTVPITVPSLRERAEDVYLLFRKFANDISERYRMPPVQLDERAVKLLESYAWRGNIRELKNVAEQVSVLAKTRQVSLEDLMTYAPSLAVRNLPSSSLPQEDDFKEREILYKLLFDMKKDLNDLKSLVFELVRTNNLRMPDVLGGLGHLQPALPSPPITATYPQFNDDAPTATKFVPTENQPLNVKMSDRFEEQGHTADRNHIVIEGQRFNDIVLQEDEEENLSLEDMERSLIRKALNKHKGKRKEAAMDLGISERTLYRKLREYNIKY